MTKLASLPANPRTSAIVPSYPRTVCVALVALGCGGISAPTEVAPTTGGSENVAGAGNAAGFGPSIYATGGAASLATGGAASLMGDVAVVFDTGGEPGTGGAPVVLPVTGGAANLTGGAPVSFETGGTGSASTAGS
jgi:hypothetical protein